MHYDVTFDTDDPQEWREAINEFIRYAGMGSAKLLIRFIRACADARGDLALSSSEEDAIRFAASLRGVQGFPVTALISYSLMPDPKSRLGWPVLVEDLDGQKWVRNWRKTTRTHGGFARKTNADSWRIIAT